VSLLRAARTRVGCPYQIDRRTKRLSVPKAYADRVAVAIETGTPRGVIKDRGLW
jgi:hypothetical protein